MAGAEKFIFPWLNSKPPRDTNTAVLADAFQFMGDQAPETLGGDASVPWAWRGRDDFTGPAVFLACADAKWITGALLAVDGGFTAQWVGPWVERVRWWAICFLVLGSLWFSRKRINGHSFHNSFSLSLIIYIKYIVKEYEKKITISLSSLDIRHNVNI